MSKFDKVFEAREDQNKESKKTVVKNTSVKNSAVKSNSAKNKNSKPSGENNSSKAESGLEKPAEAVTAPEPSKPEKQRGRPKAKRSDPAFIGFTTYIRKDTHLKVKIALLQEGKGREMSELVEDLLSNWTKNK